MKRLITTIIAIFIVALSANAQERIPMKKESSGVYTVPCEVNGLKLRFILDTGASAVSISLTEASFMLKNGYIDDEDVVGKTNVQTADGKIAENYVVNLKKIQIGSVVLNNVTAVVSSGLDAPLLLGQSVLDKLGHWSIRDGQLILNDRTDPSTLKFDDFENLENYCNRLLSDGQNEDAIIAISNYANWPDIKSMGLLLRTWSRNNHSISSLLDECIKYVLTFQFDNPYEAFECLSKAAWFYAYRLDDIEKSTQIYESIARDNKYDKSYRWTAYYHLDVLYCLKDKQQASAYAKEAVDNGMYELAQFYGHYLMENNRMAEAFNLYQLGHQKGVGTSTYELGVGYIENKWPEKNIEKGFSLLNKLMQDVNDGDAASYLCEYYFDNGTYDKVIKCLPYLHNKELKNTYEGIICFNDKQYSYARQQLENGVDYGRTYLLALRYGYLGEIYEKGLGGVVDSEKAYNNYLKLVEYDPAWGYGMLGDMFFLNELIKTDAELAYKYYVLGANNGSGYCCFRLALMNYYGVGTFQNSIKAQEYKEKAIEQGFKAADFNF